MKLSKRLAINLDASDNLSGAIDYFIQSQHNLIIIKAKKGDWEKGFNQLAEVSVRIDRNYRALGFVEGDTVFYFRL